MRLRPKLFLISLMFCIAYLPVGQSFASDMGTMDTMSEFCPGCDIDKPDRNNGNCNADNNCLTNSCLNSFSVYETAFIASNDIDIKARFNPDIGNHSPPEYQSQPPGSLYRPPIA